jgi:hypothetical protein
MVRRHDSRRSDHLDGQAEREEACRLAHFTEGTLVLSGSCSLGGEWVVRASDGTSRQRRPLRNEGRRQREPPVHADDDVGQRPGLGAGRLGAQAMKLAGLEPGFGSLLLPRAQAGAEAWRSARSPWTSSGSEGPDCCSSTQATASGASRRSPLAAELDDQRQRRRASDHGSLRCCFEAKGAAPRSLTISKTAARGARRSASKAVPQAAEPPAGHPPSPGAFSTAAAPGCPVRPAR